MVFRDLVVCGCHTLYEHDRRHCAKQKLGNVGIANLLGRAAFRQLHIAFDADWEVGGRLYYQRSVVLMNILVKGREFGNMTLDELGYIYDHGRDMISILHQPPQTILLCVKLHCKKMGYRVQSLDKPVDEIQTRNWDLLMDTLADPENHENIMGEKPRRSANKKFLKYKSELPSVAPKCAIFRMFKRREHRQRPSSIASVSLKSFSSSAVSETEVGGADSSPPGVSRASILKRVFSRRRSRERLRRTVTAPASMTTREEAWDDSQSPVSSNSERQSSQMDVLAHTTEAGFGADERTANNAAASTAETVDENSSERTPFEMLIHLFQSRGVPMPGPQRLSRREKFIKDGLLGPPLATL